MKTIALWIIAITYLANSVDIYQADNGGLNVFYGNFGYHIEKEPML